MVSLTRAHGSPLYGLARWGNARKPLGLVNGARYAPKSYRTGSKEVQPKDVDGLRSLSALQRAATRSVLGGTLGHCLETLLE